jgi:hypothetical protein
MTFALRLVPAPFRHSRSSALGWVDGSTQEATFRVNVRWVTPLAEETASMS